MVIHCAMADEALIRRARLRSLKLTPSQLAGKLGKKPSYYSDLMNESGVKSFGEKAARAIEQGLELPPLWLDQPQTKAEGVAAQGAAEDSQLPAVLVEARAQMDLLEALLVIRAQLAHASDQASVAAGEALKLLALTPDSDRAFNNAAAVLSALSGGPRDTAPAPQFHAQGVGKSAVYSRALLERVAKGNTVPEELHLLMRFLDNADIQAAREQRASTAKPDIDVKSTES